MKLSLERRVALWFVLVGAILIVTSASMFRSFARFMAARDRVEHSHQVIVGLEGFFSLMKDAETGQRGFLLTKKEPFLEPYNAALASLDRKMMDLALLLESDPDQRARLEVLKSLVREKLVYLRTNIDVRRSVDAEFGRKDQKDNLDGVSGSWMPCGWSSAGWKPRRGRRGRGSSARRRRPNG